MNADKDNQSDEIFCPKCWEDIDFDIEKILATKRYEPTKVRSFYDSQSIEEGYLICGVSPVYHEVDDPKHDFY